MRKLLLPLVLAPLVAFAAPEVPGIIGETVMKDLATGETWTNMMYVRGEDLVMEFTDPRSGASGSMVSLAETGEWIMNDDENRTYVRMDRESIAQIAERVAAMMSQVEQMLESIPAAQREAIMNAGGGSIPGMDMFAGGGIPVIEMRPTGVKEEKGGVPTERVDMFVGEKRTQEMWIAEWSVVEGAAKVRPALLVFADIMKSFMEAMPSSMFGEGGMGGFLDFERGVPVVTYELNDEGEPTVESTITGFTEGDVDPEKFGPKPGYELQEIDMPTN